MHQRRIYQAVAALVISASALVAPAQDSAERDYGAELQRIAPTEPDDALQTFEVAPGYKLELVAAEPLVTSPVAASFDENGRLYVVEMRDYSEQDQEKLGRVRLLTDSDGNGVFDRGAIFAQDLSWPTAILAYDGGVFVGAAPNILYLKDTDRDGVADVRRVVFTGFGRGNVQGLLNSFCWGLDNRIHVAVSSAGAHLQRVDAEGRPTGQPLSLRGRDFSFDPRQPDDFTATSGGGQHGMCFDDWGRKFVCSNSDHIQLIMLQDADLARNPYLAVPSPRISIAVEGPQADVFRISPVESWRELRTRLRVQGLVPGPIEGGGRAAGYFTSATGITIYRGHAWPKQDRGLAIVGDVGGNLVHRKRLHARGVELRAERIDEQREFIASRDTWFRPVQFLNAPDGALYILDMYRETIEHPASLPPIIKQHLDLTSGRDRGRIYRIVPDCFKQPPLPKLSLATTAELVQLLAHDNGWQRDTAARLLYEATDRAALPALHKLAMNGENPLGRVHALYALRGLDGSYIDEVRRLRGDREQNVRVHAVRLARGQPFAGDQYQEDGPLVTLEVALAAHDIRRSREFYERFASDPWVRAALLSSAGTSAGPLLGELCRRPEFLKHPDAPLVLTPLAHQVGRVDDPQDYGHVFPILAHLAQADPWMLQRILIDMHPQPTSRLAQHLAETPQGQTITLALRQGCEEAWRTMASAEADTAARCHAIALLRFENPLFAAPQLLKLVAVSQPPEVQVAALETLLAIDAITADGPLLERWPQLSPVVRARLFTIYRSRPGLAQGLLRAIQTGKVAASLFSAEELKLLRAQAEPELKDVPVSPNHTTTSRGEIAAAYRDALSLPAESARGAELFSKQCAACHKLNGVGHELGPNLAAMKARGREAILINVLDPNREVNPQYVSYTVETKDGRTISGMIVSETATSLTLKQAENKTETLLRIDIQELHNNGLSLMPEGLEKQLDKQQLADVIEFIMRQE